MLEMASTLMLSIYYGLSTTIVPGFEELSFMDLFIGLLTIDIAISTAFIILGVSTGAGDLPASMAYDDLVESEHYMPRSKRWEHNKRILNWKNKASSFVEGYQNRKK